MHYFSNPIYPLLFRVNVYQLLSTLLIDYHDHCHQLDHLLSCYRTAQHHLITWKFLNVYVMQLLFILLIILTLMPHIASLLDTPLVKKVIHFMTWKLRNFSSIMMLNFVRPFFIFSISTPPTPNFVLFHFPPNIPNSWAFLEPFTNIPSSQP